MERPLDFIELKSKFLRAVHLSFEIVMNDDVIFLKFSSIPNDNSPWLCQYNSTNHGAGLVPLYGLEEYNDADIEKIAKVFCNDKDITEYIRIDNIQTNYVDLFTPAFIKMGPVYPNYPEIDTDISRVTGYVLFADLRGFSNWCMYAENEQINEIFEVIKEIIVEFPSDYLINYWKLIGDGIMLVWEAGGNESNSANCAIGAAYELHKKYWYYQKESLHKVPEGFGIGVCGGNFTRFKSSTFFESCVVSDYLGPIVNQAARLQSLAKAGEVLVNRRVEKMAKDDDWHSFINVSEDLKNEIASLKGLSPNEREVFKVRHKYFGPSWENFIPPHIYQKLNKTE